MVKIVEDIEKYEVDSETGEIKSGTIRVRRRYSQEPSYVKLYLQDILYFSDMPKHNSKVLFELLKLTTYAGDEYGMVVTPTMFLKKRIAENLKITVKSVNNSLYELVKGKILIRLDTATYRLNPYLFGRGDWADIEKLRLTIDYDIHGKTFSTVVKYKDEKKTIVNQMSFDGSETPLSEI